MPMLLKKITACALMALGLLTAQTLPALACGGLIAPDGDVRLDRAATLIAWHNGIEHYMTSFAYEGSSSSLGWIVPLPSVPISPIVEGGAWTLQRLSREVHPLPPNAGAVETAAPGSADVLQQVQIEALNVTVLRGSGDQVLQWARQNGFLINDETRAHLLDYARGSPIFMAAKYDTSIAQARHQLAGDGVPILITMKIAHPWVPLEVLALGNSDVHADLYFLTDQPLNISDMNAVIGQSAVGSQVPGAPGMQVAFQERMNAALYHDLSTDRNMSWVRPDGWLTYVSLDASDNTVTYDMGISPRGVIRLAPYGTPPMAVVDNAEQNAPPSWLPSLPLGTPEIAVIVLLALGVIAALIWLFRARKPAPAAAQAGK
ncbi:MAG TPA: DUF2330 domain-containing protein [Ktedonobacterales bacterium]|nr:DUF2330 domain-containing protein [Ktedonobacterales bacterium]